jgi:predicted DNA-binding transcriptional regulator AlpA
MSDKLLWPPAETAARLSMSRAKFYQLCSSGAFAPLPVRFGRKVLYRAEDVTQWVSEGCKPRGQWRPDNIS